MYGTGIGHQFILFSLWKFQPVLHITIYLNDHKDDKDLKLRALDSHDLCSLMSKLYALQSDALPLSLFIDPLLPILHHV